ncbi:MAG TPA: hypothetical protein PK177_14545, partial [Burkholderiaceae bacterium]|nr:hypothetical protein [Burkholderiaceae bacterium]
MIVSCPSCGRSNPPWASYCVKCGMRLDETAPVDRATSANEREGPLLAEQTPTGESSNTIAIESAAAEPSGAP